MKRIALSILALLLAMLLPGLAPAQRTAPQNGAPETKKQEDAALPPVRIAGAVHTAKGIPVPSAPVQLLHLPTGKAWMITTDESGNFTVPDLPPGRYRIEARHLGLGSASQEIEITSDSASPIVLTLRVAAAVTKTEAAPNAQTEKPAETTTQPGTARPATESVESTSKSEGAKHHHHKQAAEAARTGTPEANPPRAQEKPQISEKPAVDKAQAQAADASSHKKHKAGFQQVEVTGLPTAATDPTQSQDTPLSADAAPLGEASSSDSYLLTGGVAQTSTANAAVNLAGVNPNGPGQGMPGQVAREDDSSGGKDLAKGQGKRSHKGKGNSAQGDNLGEGLDALAARENLKHMKSNRMHASLYNIYGNSVGDARAYSLTDPQPAKIGYYREQFGARIGGPLAIPHIYDGKEKTFFFANYELDRHRSPLDAFQSVPTAPERLGDFTDRGVTLYDPLSNISGPRQAMGSVIPQDKLNKAAVGLLNLIPLPNLPGLVQNYHYQTALPAAIDRVNVRVLHTISPRFNLSVGYNFIEFRGQTGNTYPTLQDSRSIRDQNATIGFTQNWTPRLINETRVNYNRSHIELGNNFQFQQDLAGELGITGVSQAPIDWGPPNINLTNFTGIASAVPTKERNQTFRLLDNISYALSKHTLSAGAEIRRRQQNLFLEPTPRGDFTFSGLMTSQLDASGQVVDGTGFDLADFLLGLPETTSLQFGSESNYLRNWWFVGYFQDDWRIHPRFSLNWGVRYELVTPEVEKYDRLTNLDLNSNISALALVLPGQVAPFSGVLPRSLLRTNTNDWAPRLGIAWRPFQRGGPVVRAGYGIFYNGSVYDRLYGSMIQQPPFAQTTTRVTSATALLTLQEGFPPQPPDAVSNTIAIDPNYKVGAAQIWNLTVETPILSTLLLEVTYTGTKGTHLDLLRAPNRATPGPIIGADQRRRIPSAPDFRYETSGADSIYHGMQVRVQRRMAHGMRLLFLYNYGKSIDNAGAIGLGDKGRIVQDDMNFAAERALSSFDVRHQIRIWYTYELPFGERKRWLRDGWLSNLFGNWTLSGNTTFSTGLHFTAHLNGANVNGTGALYSQRPDQIGDPNNLPDSQRTVFQFFNTAAFALPPLDRYGNAARNTIVGPGTQVVNVALARRIHIGKDERYRMEFRWQVSNLFNQVNFTRVGDVVGSADFGHLMGSRPMRTMELVLRIHF